MARFGQAFFWEASAPHNPPLALPSYLPIGPTNCFYSASKLLHGTFWPGLKTFKSPAAAFESLSTAQPSACFAIVPPHRPFKLFLLGLKLLHGTFWPGLKSPKSSAAAFESLRTAQPSACFAIVYLPIGPSNCFYWASKLLHGTFWPGLLLGSLSTAQPSACFAIVPPHRPYKLFLLGFETATWHVLARP